MGARSVGEFWRELRRRKVVRVGLVYLVIGWALVEASSVVMPALLLPDWTERFVLVLIIAGFPIALVLAWAFELSPDGIHRDSGANPEDSSATGGKATDPASGTTDRPSIAVLPMANLSDDPENEYFSDGISEEILNLLSKLSNVRVASRTSAFSFKDKGLDLKTIGAELGVDWLLEGSVRRAGDRVRISAQLIDAATDSHVWSEIYDREIGDIFALQAEIAQRIVASMRQSHGPAIKSMATTDNVEAYEYYLRGRQYFHQTGHSYDHAERMFRKAIEIDPDYARAHAGLADWAAMVAQWIDHSPRYLALADSASRRALELAPDLADAHASRGFALSMQGEYEAAAQCFERAVELDPQLYEAWYLYGRCEFAAGRFEHAAELWTRAHEVQPEEYQSACLTALAYNALGRDEDVMKAARHARIVMEKHLERHPDDVRALGLSAGTLINLGQTEEGLARADRAISLAPNDLSVLHNAACSYAHAGQTERALELMEKRLEMGGTMYREWLENDTDFDSVRDDPRFHAILDRLPRLEAQSEGLPDAPGG